MKKKLNEEVKGAMIDTAVSIGALALTTWGWLIAWGMAFRAVFPHDWVTATLTAGVVVVVGLCTWVTYHLSGNAISSWLYVVRQNPKRSTGRDFTVTDDQDNELLIGEFDLEGVIAIMDGALVGGGHPKGVTGLRLVITTMQHADERDWDIYGCSWMWDDKSRKGGVSCGPELMIPWILKPAPMLAADLEDEVEEEERRVKAFFQENREEILTHLEEVAS